MKQGRTPRGERNGLTTLCAAVLAALALPQAASAFEINTGNEDLVVRWDNTFRYNLGVRAQGQDDAILKNVNLDDGDRNFKKNSIVTNRLDVLSEFDIVWKRQFGARVSAAGWFDGAYGSLDNTNTATANTLVNGLPVAGELSSYSKRYTKGPSGEWLDAFVFANVDLGGMPFSAKVGQHTVYWGESLLLGGAVHGMSYSQNALDLAKGFATPGAEAKELFRPRGGITLQLQPTADVSLAAQWFYNWQAVRVPESGSYLTVNDALQFGAMSAIVGANPFAAAIPGSPAMLRAWNVSNQDSRNSSSIGDFGLAARWSPQWLDGTLGLYYRNATDMLPQQILTPGLATGVPAATCTAIGGIVVTPTVCIVNPKATNATDLTQKGKFGTYQFAYGDNIHMLGLALSKNIAGVAIGAELSYRENMPLLSDNIVALPTPLVNRAAGQISINEIPAEGTPGALGKTMHGLVNFINLFPGTALFDAATLQGELTWMQWLSVSQNEAVFKGRSAYTAIDRPSKNFFGLALNFTPVWYQALPGVDIYAPITWSQGLSGNAAVTLGGNKGTGTWSLGVGADVYQKYRFDLKYLGYYGDYSTNPANGALTVANGVAASLSDRGWVSLTFKATF